MESAMKNILCFSFGVLLALVLALPCWSQEPDSSRCSSDVSAPKLELKFEDEFAADTRSDYKISSVEGAVGWEKGKLVLAEGAILQRNLDVGPWVKIELDLEWPEPAGDSSVNELQIWFILDGATNCFVHCRREITNGNAIVRLALVDTQEKDGKSLEQIVRKEEVPGSAPESIAIQYRHGMVTVTVREHELLRAYINNRAAECETIRLTGNGGDIALARISVYGEIASSIALTLLQQEELAKAEQANVSLIRLYQAGEFESATQIGKQVLAIRDRILSKQDPDYAVSLNNLAQLYYRLGQYECAEPLWVQARDIRKKVLGEEHPDYASSLNNLAALYESMGQYERAEPLYVQARDIRKKVLGEEHPDYAVSLNNLALHYYRMGQYERAEPLNVQARDIRKKVLGEEHPDYAVSLNNLALLYYSMGQYERAEPLYVQARDIRKKVLGEEHPSYASSLNNLALLYDRMGQYERAEPLYVQANDICKKVLGEEHPLYATFLSNLALLYDSMGQYERAEPLYVQARDIRKKVLGEEHPSYASSLNNLALLYELIGQYERAEPLYVQARDICKKVLGEEHPLFANSLDALAGLYELMGQNEQAEPLLHAALQIVRNNLERYSVIQSAKQQREYTRSFEDRFSAFVTNALKLEDRGSAVWEQAVRWKGTSLVREKRNLVLAGLPETESTFNKLKSVKAQLSKHIQASPTSQNWKERLDDFTAREEKLEKQLIHLAADLDLIVADDDLKIELPDGSCLVDFRRFTYSEPDPKQLGKFIYEPHYLSLILNADGKVKMLDLGPAEEIESGIARWRGPIEAANKNLRPVDSVGQQAMDQAGLKLRQLLWDPIKKHLGDSKLVIVSPDGALGRFPFIALPGKEPGTFLIEERKIVSVAVPALLPNMLSRPPQALSNNTDVLLVGDLEYGNPHGGDNPDLLVYRNSRLLGYLKFSPLPGSRAEIDGIDDLFKSGKLLTGPEATELVFEEQLAGARVLHIATHGFFRSPDNFMKNLPADDKESFVTMREQAKVLTENPNMLSGLAFADANSASSKTIDEGESDGILYSAEIAMLPMEHVELAVLSACETSLGTDNNPGEGLIGIQRAFQVAGAKTTVASYWKVNDLATQMLMKRFYENLIEYGRRAQASGVDPNSNTVRVDALRDAQLWMLRGLDKEQVAQLTRGVDDETELKDIRRVESADTSIGRAEYISHPRYWAAFVLSGDWR